MTSPPHSFIPSFFFNATATTEIYTLSLHDALPISIPLHHSLPPTVPGRSLPERPHPRPRRPARARRGLWLCLAPSTCGRSPTRSEEHTSELQSRPHLVCRLLLEKKKKNYR